MSIFNHFKHLNLSQGQETALTKLEAFLASPVQVFMLKGYAGSGKTTILKGLVEYLNLNKKEFILMAPTGRAAKVLRDKTGHGVTIHKGIYNFAKLESVNQNSEDDAEHSFHYYFPINEAGTSEKIIIVDESSMISSVESKNELFTFGTNILLNDLMTFARLQTSKSKVIFVGDPAQLPPYGDSKSLALDKNYFNDLGIVVEETEMTEVLRQGDNLILKNAKQIRELLAYEKRNKLQFQFDEDSFIKTQGEDVVRKFADLFPVPEIGNGIVISYSNAQCYHYNIAIRERIFPDQTYAVPGDLLLINNNNYHTYGAELFNGDIAKVISVNPEIVTQSAPVFCDVNGVKVRKNINLNFRKIVIRIPSHPDEINCYIIDSLLHSINRDLTICEMKSLYINFMMRFNGEQKKRKDAGEIYFKVGSDEFKQALKNDPFFNALKVKFGYAITCHKAQGGEWDKVFVDYHGRVSLKTDPLKWCYTATTRGINTVFAINTPHFGKLDKFKFASLGTIGTLPNDALALDTVLISPFHNVLDHNSKSLKYWEILKNWRIQIFIL
ncbi:MAG: AAA family ATPase [Bacteroidetes bacterium]|nr:AAA family ATPase [Bacteroidota bacterium]